jgi:hypothetical protein
MQSQSLAQPEAESPPAPPSELREFFAANGRKGGKSRSKAKLEAIAANLAKAQAARWKGKVKSKEGKAA